MCVPELDFHGQSLDSGRASMISELYWAYGTLLDLIGKYLDEYFFSSNVFLMSELSM